MTKLDARTVEEFERYAKDVEQQLTARWQGQRAFLSIEDQPAERERVMHGALAVEPAIAHNPVVVYDGLIHDWEGAVYIPNATMRRVLDVLQDFDQHAKMYPSVTKSRLVGRHGNEIEGYWRLERRDALLTVVLDVRQRAYYQEIAPGRWTCRAYADDISEVEHAGTARERALPPGEGHGFLWRLNAYWSLEALGGGVLAECRTLSLSREVPKVLAWVINPFVQKLPRESLVSTLEHTREAAQK